jgi:hypothetical protein
MLKLSQAVEAVVRAGQRAEGRGLIFILWQQGGALGGYSAAAPEAGKGWADIKAPL